MPLSLNDLAKFTQNTETAADFQELCDAFCELALKQVGAKLFTLTTIDLQEGLARRLYSNMPDAYPVSGTKPMTADRWSQHVIDNHKTFIASSIEAISEVFPDHELIYSLGCESVLNLPIVCSGETLGTVNLLHEANFYDDKEELALSLKLPGLCCFLAQKHLERTNHG